MKIRLFKIYGRRYNEGYPKPEIFFVVEIEGLRKAQSATQKLNNSTTDLYYWYEEVK
jgi:hypothetical protein